MAISAAVQTLTAAFSFGILLQAATGALLIYSKGHGSTIFKNGQRLALVLFLIFAALWALVDFLTLMILTPSTCQVALVFSTVFDQLARVSIEQFLLWSVAQGMKINSGQWILQAVLVLRLIAGAILVGFTRPDFAPVCIARTSLEHVAVVVIALDFVIIGAIFVRSMSIRGMKDSRLSTRAQSRGLVFTIVGFTMWTATSIAMMLETHTIILIARTMVPANGLLILVGILTLFSASLLEMREEITTPEAHSPFVAPLAPSRELFREEVGNGSPISGHNYTRSGSLFVVNPSRTPRDSPTAAQVYFQGNNQRFSKLGEKITVKDMGVGEVALKNTPGYRRSSGIFPAIIGSSTMYDEGAAAPQIRTNIVSNTQNVPKPSIPQPTVQQKRSLFNRPKQPTKPTIRSIGISKPLLNEESNSSPHPFARIQTIDLAQAAVNERERREAAAERAHLIANRPAPPPPPPSTLPAAEALRQSIGVKRKEMPNIQPREPMPISSRSASSALSVNSANGSTTSASLSPGGEEVRRRSPRNAVNSFDKLIDEKSTPILNPQRKQTIGLPSNPRANRRGPAPSMAKDQTITFINNIVYDDFGFEKTITKEASEIYASAKRVKTPEDSSIDSYTTDLKSAGSILHRPRPYRRDSEIDRAIFPSEQSPRHKRSKSGSSITTRKPILMSHPGSPTRLPPLPPPPTSASKLKRLLPNDIKSMTLDEKIHLLFPAPPSVTHNRRSSVPSLPRVTPVFTSESPLTQSPTQEEAPNQRASKRATVASFSITDGAIQPPEEASSQVSEIQTYRFSANAYRTLADQVGETWVPGIPVQDVNYGVLFPEATGSNLHVVNNTRESNMTDVSSSNVGTDSVTYWGSIHSNAPAVDLSKMMRNANSTLIQRPRTSTLMSREYSSVQSPPTAEEMGHGEEIMIVMLDETEESSRSALTSSNDNRRSFFLDANQDLPGDETPTPKNGKAWHRRIGDELPTFSERKAKTRSRKMPPPTPLLLNQRGRAVAVVVPAAEPSPPIDSSEQAIAEIQAQLKRFEEPDRGSVGSLLRRMPDAISKDDSTVIDDHSDRFRLLQNLENEMGQQENQWQQMQTSLDRDSISSIMTPQVPTESGVNLSREPSQRSSRTPSRVISRRARIRSSMGLRSKEDGSTSTTSTQSSDSSRASVWQQRLAEAQVEYMENAPTLLRKQSMNFLSVAKSHQLGSPTPPDSIDSGTDLDTDSEIESENEQASVGMNKKPASLWEASLQSPKAAAGRMWHPHESAERASSPEPPARSVRPIQRRMQSPMQIFSTNLWKKPLSSVSSRPVVGLWGSRLVRPISIKTRPVTQRPQRKSKRVTFLPDIIESPVPLPNKRDTLGIFQFPWGETSDSAVYQPTFNPALLAGPILNAKLDARSQQLESEYEYSSSFFDDYDEDMDEDEDEDVDQQSDDDFDETTLWEIASLLKSSEVPSKNSLLPQPQKIIEDYDNDEDTDFEEDSEAEEVYQSSKAVEHLGMKLPIMPLAMSSKEKAKVEPRLWLISQASSPATLSIGLPQPEPSVWQAYIPSSDDIVTSKPRSSEKLSVLASRDLWTLSKSEATSLSGTSMWSGNTSPNIIPSTSQTAAALSKFMWKPQPKKFDVNTAGLFSLDGQRSEFRTTQAIPTVAKRIRAPQSSNASVSTLSSMNLWSPEQTAKIATVWISKLPTVSPKAVTQLMWAPTPKIETVTTTGLFTASSGRSDYRTTSLQPAALNMTVKPRLSFAHLPELTSRKLWNKRSCLTNEHHWISESSIRPESPSIYSESSSGHSSPASETSSISGASIQSTSTKASSIWDSIDNTIRTGWWGSKDSQQPPSPTLPIDNIKDTKSVSKLPIAKGLVAARESRISALRDLWDAKALVPLAEMPKCKSTIAAPTKEEKATYQPLRRQYRHVIAFRANWDEALAEAIAAGTPKKILSHPIASKADWDAALAEAVFMSKPRLQRTKASTAMWEAALNEAIIKGITSPRLSVPCYNAAVIHPVFFTSNLVSNVIDIHPAGMGYFAKPQAKTMWTAPCSYAAVLEAPIGSMWHKGKIAASQFESDMIETKRRPPVSRSDKLAVLESTSTWQPSKSIPVQECNWISTKLARAQTWTARKGVEEGESGGMWTEKINMKVAPPNIFVHHNGEHIKKASPRPAALPRLNSTELFTPISSVTKDDNKHWLHLTSTSMVRSATSAGMWIAPKIAPSSQMNETDLFSQMKGEYIKKAAGTRPALPASLGSNELDKTETDTHWLHSTSSSSTSTTRPTRPVASSSALQSIPVAVKRSQTWTPPIALSAIQAQQESSKMWEGRRTEAVKSPTMFEKPHTVPWNRKKRFNSAWDMGVEALESKEMWSRKWVMPESPKQWLVINEKTITKVQFRY